MDRDELHAFIEANHGNIRQIVAMKDGITVYEDNFEGFNSDDALHIFSVTKSVTSLLTGIAMDKGLIRDASERVLDFFPDYGVKRGEMTIRDVTLEHLLTMRAPYKYKSEPWSKVCRNDDWTSAALDLLGGRSGITGEFKYSTLGIQILTGLIAISSGMTVVEFANRFLFEPLGIAPRRSIELETAEVHKAFILSKQPKENVWVADTLGVNTAGWGLCLSASEMAKLGQMCLEHGMCANRRIVSAEWIAQSTRPHYRCDERFANMSYGFLWWIPDEGRTAYAAIGDGGNVIYIDPERNTVVAITAVFRPRVFNRVQLIQGYIEPMLDEAFFDTLKA